MKQFTIVTLFTLALALGVQSSVIPWGNVLTQVAGGHLSYTAVTSPVVSPWPLGGAVVVGHQPAIPTAYTAAVHAAVPAAVPAIVAAGHAVVPVGHGSYVAQTRGAVHSAPLAGHLNSVANVNVAPAAGTI